MMTIKITTGWREYGMELSRGARAACDLAYERHASEEIEEQYPGADVTVTIDSRAYAEMRVSVAPDEGASSVIEARVHAAVGDAIPAAYRAAMDATKGAVEAGD